MLFIKKHLHEPDFGAKSLTLQAYHRGSVDNITVLVIVFKNGSYRISNSGNSVSNSNSLPKDKPLPTPTTVKKSPSFKKFN